MSDKNRDFANVIVGVAFILILAIWCIIKPDDDISISERRHLAQKPQFNMETVFDKTTGGSFMDLFEKYAVDQFPLREGFRKINSMFSINVLGRKEVNDLYDKNGYIAKVEYGINSDSVKWSLDRISYVNNRFLDNCRVFFSVIPDKAFYLNDDSYPKLDMSAFIDEFRKETDKYASFIDLRNVLSIENYYYTDTHWKQETLQGVANHLISEMGGEYNFSFEINELPKDFKGVYYGQYAMSTKLDKIKYLTGDYIDNLIVKCYDTGKEEEIGVYNFGKAEGMDMYEFFLSGSKSLITIENPNSKSDKELIVFRDSFGSSLVPLLCGNYKKTTMIDIRYINPAMLDRFVEFNDKDVLFIYCAQVLNNSVGQFIK